MPLYQTTAYVFDDVVRTNPVPLSYRHCANARTRARALSLSLSFALDRQDPDVFGATSLLSIPVTDVRVLHGRHYRLVSVIFIFPPAGWTQAPRGYADNCAHAIMVG